MAKITTLDGVTHDVEVGDKVRITRSNGDFSEVKITAVFSDRLRSEGNVFLSVVTQSVEVLERYVKLPTKSGAIVGHTTYGGYVTYQLSENEGWFKVDTTCGGAIYRASEERVLRAMRVSEKFTVLYEGRG